MKRSILLLVGVVLATASLAEAQMVTFDFNALGFLDRDLAISSYMSSVYGSKVTTDGAVSSNDRSDIGVGETNFFIATSLQLLNRGDFEILFEDVPIVGAQFEGHVIDPTVGDDFRFIAFSGDTEVFRFERNDGVEIFDSGWHDFGEPVDRIVVTDSGRKDVGIDDFVVQMVPEPATGLILIPGLYCLIRRRPHRAGRS